MTDCATAFFSITLRSDHLSGQSATRRGGRGGGDRLDDEGEAGEAWSGAGVGQPDGVDLAPPHRRRRGSCEIWG